MAKGYWIASVDVADADAYGRYVASNGPAFARFGGRFLVRGGAAEVKEGRARARNVVIEFPTYEAARRCYESEEYQGAMAHRANAADFNLLIVEGYDGPQPGE